MREIIFYVVIAGLWLGLKSWLSGRKQQATPEKRAVPPQSAASQTRRVAAEPSPSPFSSSPKPAAGEDSPGSLQDALKRLMGMEEEEDEEEVEVVREAKPVPPPVVRSAPRSVRKQKAEVLSPRPMRPIEAARITEPTVLSGTLAPRAGQLEAEAKQTADALWAKANVVPAVATVARRLRGNPAAMREAFIYAEILGPPVADR